MGSTINASTFSRTSKDEIKSYRFMKQSICHDHEQKQHDYNVYNNNNPLIYQLLMSHLQ